MTPEATQTEQSTILSPEEVTQTLEATEAPTEIPQALPSEVEGVPEKFQGKSVEDVIKAYQELESKLGAQPPAETPVETPQVPTSVSDTIIELYTEREGKLTEADYAGLAKKGYNKDFIDTYIEGANAKVAKEQEEALQAFGYSMEDYQAAIKWAGETWNETQREAYNKALEGADSTAQMYLVSSVIKDSKAAGSTPNQPIHSNVSTTPEAVKGYATKSDYMKDSQDKRYGKDPGYTKAVENKLVATDTKVWYDGLQRY